MHSRFVNTGRIGDVVDKLPHCRLFPVVLIDEGAARVTANFGTDPDKPFIQYDPSQYGTDMEHSTVPVEAPVAA
jgi:hypothetical protein